MAKKKAAGKETTKRVPTKKRKAAKAKTATRAESKSPPEPRKKRPQKKRTDTATQKVRDYMQAHPEAKNREIILAMAMQGVVIDEYLPAAVRSRARKASPKKVPPTKPSLPSGDPTVVFIQAPVGETFFKEIERLKTHVQVVKAIRVLVARLNRVCEMLELMKDDDWTIKLISEQPGLIFSARHHLMKTPAEVRARMEKLNIKPNEVELAPEKDPRNS